jgi:aldehyde dehydrogenase (NAD+)
MGNSVLLKPAPQTPFGLRILIECLAEAGVPAGVVAYLPGDREVGEALTTHPDIDMVSFTGSSAVGERILESAASTIKRVTLELGGKSPAIIRPDADLDEAIDGVIFGCFIYAGQVCTAGSRILVQKGMYQPVVDRLAERVRSLVIGPPRDANTDIGPLIRREQIGRLSGYIARAVAAGARIACGGGAPAGNERGFFFEPTLVTDVTNDMEIAREELFGPVAVVIPYDDDEDAIRIANDTPYGLAAAIWTRDLRAARKMSRRLRAGTVWINEHHAFQANTPFGGMKQSGLGREGSEQGFYNFTETKHLYTSMAAGRRGHYWPLPKLEKTAARGA